MTGCRGGGCRISVLRRRGARRWDTKGVVRWCRFREWVGCSTVVYTSHTRPLSAPNVNIDIRTTSCLSLLSRFVYPRQRHRTPFCRNAFQFQRLFYAPLSLDSMLPMKNNPPPPPRHRSLPNLSSSSLTNSYAGLNLFPSASNANTGFGLVLFTPPRLEYPLSYRQQNSTPNIRINCLPVSPHPVTQPPPERNTHSPNLRIPPIQQRINPHNPRPIPVRRAKMLQKLAVRIRPPRAHEHGAHRRPVADVRLERRAHRQRVALEVEVVGLRGGGDEGLDFREGVGRRDVDCLEALRGEGGRGGFGRWWGDRGGREAGEDEEEEDEAVFAAVVGEGDLVVAVRKGGVSLAGERGWGEGGTYV